MSFWGKDYVQTTIVLIGLMLATSANARPNIPELVKQIAPKISTQLAKIAHNRKVAVKAICVATACALNFSAPTHADYWNDLDNDATIARTRGTLEIIEKSTNTRSFKKNFWLAGGYYGNDHDDLGTLRVGFKGNAPNFSVYYTFVQRVNSPEDFDDIALKIRSYMGLKFTLRQRNNGQSAFGYVSADFKGSNKLRPHTLQAYLLRNLHKLDTDGIGGKLNIAMMGVEYRDYGNKSLADAKGMRGLYWSLYRASYIREIGVPSSVNVKVGDEATRVEIQPLVNLKLKLIHVLGTGKFWQDDLNTWAGEDSDLGGLALFQSVSGNLSAKFGDRLILSIGGEYATTIDGRIHPPSSEEEGTFNLNRLHLGVRSNLVLLPAHDISLEAVYNWYLQDEEAKLDGETYDRTNSGNNGRLVLVKRFK